VEQWSHGQQSDDHQQKTTPAFDMGRSAEEEPPHNNNQANQGSAHHGYGQSVRHNQGSDKLDQKYKYCGNKTRPKAKRFWLRQFIGCSFEHYQILSLGRHEH